MLCINSFIVFDLGWCEYNSVVFILVVDFYLRRCRRTRMIWWCINLVWHLLFATTKHTQQRTGAHTHTHKKKGARQTLWSEKNVKWQTELSFEIVSIFRPFAGICQYTRADKTWRSQKRCLAFVPFIVSKWKLNIEQKLMQEVKFGRAFASLIFHSRRDGDARLIFNFTRSSCSAK